jgi:putative chitinase
MILKPETLKKICPTLSFTRATTLANLFAEVLPKFGMYTIDILQEFLAQVAHESGEFSIKDESMSYSAKRLMDVWPSRFPAVKDTVPYVKNPQALANKVYGGRMGNTSPTDGYDFRGGGYLQLTGRDSYTQYASYSGLASPEEAALRVRTQDYYALHAACWEFAVNKKLLPLCKVNDFATDNSFKAITKAINGGYIGLTERLVYYSRAIKYLATT